MGAGMWYDVEGWDINKTFHVLNVWFHAEILYVGCKRAGMVCREGLGQGETLLWR